MNSIEKAVEQARESGQLEGLGSVEARGSDAQKMVPVRMGRGRNQIDQRIESSRAIANMRESKVLDKRELDRRLIIHPDTGHNKVVESFRQIRTTITKQAQGANAVIMVTSVVGNGGNSFVALNLGAAFALDTGKTALVIDCNLRNPFLTQLVLDEDGQGLVDYLENENIDVDKIIHAIGIERLRVVPAGGKRESTSEYFTSEKVKNFLEGVKSRYVERYIILDAPPVEESADAQILSDLADYVLLVVPYGRVTKVQLDAAVKALDKRKLLGVIFNDVPNIPPKFKARA